MLPELYKHKAGDRYDGWRVRGVKGVMCLMPYVQRTRLDGQCFFSDEINLAPIEKFIDAHKDDMPGLSIMEIVIAALVRTISQHPYLNRFLVNSNLYAHKSIQISFMAKKSLDIHAEETAIRPVFSPFSTLPEVVKVIEASITEFKDGKDNATDEAVNMLGVLPPFLLRFIVWILRFLDRIGCMPKSLFSASPYHTSAFVTNMGSLGILPIYHHLYDFGTCSIFVAMGKKTRKMVVGRDGKTSIKKLIGIKTVFDERVCDGYYSSSSMRYMSKLLSKPEDLMTPPDKIVLDDGILHKLVYDPNKKTE